MLTFSICTDVHFYFIINVLLRGGLGTFCSLICEPFWLLKPPFLAVLK